MMNEILYAKNDSMRQSLRLRRTLMALVGGVFHTLLCLLIWDMGFFNTSLTGFIILFLCFWIIHLSFPLIILLGWNKQFSDPSMTFAEVLWSITCVLITVYLTDEMRPAVMMFVLLSLSFGAFQLNQKQFIGLTVYALAGYLFVLYLLEYYRPLEIVYREEIIAVSAFIIVCIIFSMVTHEMGSIRKHLQKKTIQLKNTLVNVEIASITDELTGAKNRRFIFGVLEQQRWMAERQSHYTFALLMLDIDHFKKINDEYGHGIGDEILKAVCLIIEKELRKMDFFGRIGGEEFLIIIPFCDAEKASILAERIRAKVELTDFSHLVINKKITVSIGVTLFHFPENIEESLKRVDRGMYSAKDHGRNRVVMI